MTERTHRFQLLFPKHLPAAEVDAVSPMVERLPDAKVDAVSLMVEGLPGVLKAPVQSSAPHKPGVVTPACKPGLGRWRQEDSNFKVILHYRGGGRPGLSGIQR